MMPFLVACLALALAGCGGDDSSVDEAPTPAPAEAVTSAPEPIEEPPPEPEPEPEPPTDGALVEVPPEPERQVEDESSVLSADEAQAIADAIVLTLNDFESGWRSEPFDNVDPPCVSSVTDEIPPLGNASSGKFVKNETSNITSLVWVFETKAMADQAWEGLVSSDYNDCILDMERALYEDDDEYDVDVNVRVGGLSFGGFAERTAAAQFVIELEPELEPKDLEELESAGFDWLQDFDYKIYRDLIWLQDDTAVTALHFVEGFRAPLTFLEEELAGKVADRMAVATGG